MSTRANVIIQESDVYQGKRYIQRLYFFRHSDGYPSGVEPTLKKFVELLKSGHIRRNVSQASGWLIILGAIEYNSIPKYNNTEDYPDILSIGEPKNWKCGSYEPTTGIHGDIEHLYLIDLNKQKYREIPSNQWGNYQAN